MCEPIPWTSVARTQLQAQPQTSKDKANASVWSEGRDASATWWPPDDTEAIIIEESVTYVQGTEERSTRTGLEPLPKEGPARHQDCGRTPD